MYQPNCPLKAPETNCQLLPDGRERTASTADYPCVAGADFYHNNACSLHWHEEFELVLVNSGTLTAAVNGARHTLGAGEGIFVNSGVLHAYQESEGTEARVTYVLFLPALVGGTSGSVFWKKYLDPLTASVELSAVALRSQPWQQQALAAVQEIARLQRDEPSGFEIEVRTHLSRITQAVCEHAATGGPEGEPSFEAAQSMRKMLAYLEDNFSRDIHVGDIAVSAHISIRSCQRLFKRFTSQSPRQFLIRLRLEKAQHLLLETARSIPEISAECGFTDQSYFTKLFRKHLGSPPALFRRRSRPQPETG